MTEQKKETLHVGYVLHSVFGVLLQLPDDNEWGFVLADDDQSWPGGLVGTWEALADDDPRITADDRRRLEWILTERPWIDIEADAADAADAAT